jgi:hypothetical protein
VGVRRRLDGVVEEAEGRGEPGRRQAAGAAREKGLEVGDGPDRWAPPVGGCVRERGREAGAGRPAWAESG